MLTIVHTLKDERPVELDSRLYGFLRRNTVRADRPPVEKLPIALLGTGGSEGDLRGLAAGDRRGFATISLTRGWRPSLAQAVHADHPDQELRLSTAQRIIRR